MAEIIGQQPPLEANEYYFQIDTRTNIVVGYLDYQPDLDNLPANTDFERLEVPLEPSRYIGLDKQYLGQSKLPSNASNLTDLENARLKAKSLFLDLQFATDVNDPDLATIQSNYNDAKADYIALRDNIPA